MENFPYNDATAQIILEMTMAGTIAVWTMVAAAVLVPPALIMAFFGQLERHERTELAREMPFGQEDA